MYHNYSRFINTECSVTYLAWKSVFIKQPTSCTYKLQFSHNFFVTIHHLFLLFFLRWLINLLCCARTLSVLIVAFDAVQCSIKMLMRQTDWVRRTQLTTIIQTKSRIAKIFFTNIFVVGFVASSLFSSRRVLFFVNDFIRI